jgi:D-methionine transport system ATP-binding protein
VILSTHQLDLIQDWGNRLWHLSQGKLVQDNLTQQVNWQALKQQFITAQQQDIQEWESEA